uniref:Uncharacterized protein n=1 Tax=Anguilla anguilla TaxID=7936 RepID=A0A0E9RW69_ANGAN
MNLENGLEALWQYLHSQVKIVITQI